jgi:hypothetical protein
MGQRNFDVMLERAGGEIMIRPVSQKLTARTLAVLTSLLLASTGLVPFAAAQCPAGTVQIGTREDPPANGVIVTHPVCKRQPAESEGSRATQAREYVKSGSALIGGTTWIMGYYVPPGASNEFADRAFAELKRQAVLAGTNYDEALDRTRYNFAIGVAAQTSAFYDLTHRVYFDQLLNGAYTVQGDQNAYNSMKGRQFDELGCHSNGAMICLAALRNKDVIARRVVLYGPQITIESLKLWNEMLERKEVESVEIMLNQFDGIPPASFMESSVRERGVNLVSAIQSGATFFRPGDMKLAIQTVAPKLAVKTFGCSASSHPGIACHDMKSYRQNHG